MLSNFLSIIVSLANYLFDSIGQLQPLKGGRLYALNRHTSQLKQAKVEPAIQALARPSTVGRGGG